MKISKILLSCQLVIIFLSGCTQSADMNVLDTRCEYLSNPDGLDTKVPRFSWIMQSTVKNQNQSAYRIIVSSSLAELDKDNGDIWDSGEVISDRSNQIEFNGKELASNREYFWKVMVWDMEARPSKWSNTSRWSMGLLEKSDWKAKWIGVKTDRYNEIDYLAISRGNPPITPSPMFRKTFVLDQSVLKAYVYVTALGLYELQINGEKVGDHQLAPEWTDYSSRVQYQKYDITGLLTQGENSIGATLGDGWYIGTFGQWGVNVRRGDNYGSLDRKFLVQMEILTTDSVSRTIVTDDSWKAYLDGPIRCADMFLGTTTDTRKRVQGWQLTGFTDETWETVDIFPDPEIELVAQVNEPIRVIEKLKPVALTEPDSGIYIFNLGQNIVGWCQLVLDEPEGNEIILRHGERLTEDGFLYTQNLRRAEQKDIFITSGEKMDTLEPLFTYHGFQYIEITGLKNRPNLESLSGIAISSDAELTGRFECSSPELNQLWRNILWTQRDNQHSIPTDCPQRDERMGWMGDALVFSQTAIFNMNMASFYSKWIQDIRDAQTEEGEYADFAPYPNAKFVHLNAPGWADAGIIVPFRLYQNYSDIRVIQEHYQSAKKFIDFVHKRNPDLVWNEGGGHNFGDWLNGDLIKSDDYPSEGATMPKDAFATAYFAYSTRLFSVMATLLNHTEDARKYSMLADSIKQTFITQFVSPDGKISGDTQAGYALALDFNLLPDTLRQPALNHMLRRISDYDGRISTGFHSTISLMKELVNWDSIHIAYNLLESRRLSSWLYPIDLGATTIWERWDGYVSGRGFQSIGMNSFNHYTFGSVAEWMYRTILGINPMDEYPGFKKFVISPLPGGSLTWAKGSYNSIYGEISVDWKIENDQLILSINIPVNTRAVVYIPSKDPANIRIDGLSIENHDGIQIISLNEDRGVFELGSGSYDFISNYAHVNK